MSSTTSKPKSNKAAALARVLALIAGTQKHLSNQSFTVDNASFTSDALVQLFQSLVDAITAVNEAHGRVKDALAALRVTNAKVLPIMRGFRRIVLVMYAGATPTLADFGLEPPKAPKPRTLQQSAAAAAKAKATRQARGTTSLKKKLAIHGNVTGVTVTPITAPEATPAVQPPAAPAATPPVVPAEPPPAASPPATQLASTASTVPLPGSTK